MMPDPATISIIHEHMINESTEQHRPPRRGSEEKPGRRRVGAPRRFVARALRAIAQRIQPAPPARATT